MFFQNLGFLNLAGSWRLTDDTVWEIASNNHHMQDLTLGSAPPNKDERMSEDNFAQPTDLSLLSLQYLSQNCKHLSTLTLQNLSNFSQFPSSHGHTAVVKFAHLLSLNLAHNEQMTIKTLQVSEREMATDIMAA